MAVSELRVRAQRYGEEAPQGKGACYLSGIRPRVAEPVDSHEPARDVRLRRRVRGMESGQQQQRFVEAEGDG